MRRGIPFLALLLAVSCGAEQLKTLFNGVTGGPDYYTALSTSSISAGSGILVSTTSSGVTISASGSAASNLQVTRSGVQITSPTSSMNFYSGDFNLSAAATTSQIYLNPGTTNFIWNTSALQSGATFYTSSGTVDSNFYTSSATFRNIGVGQVAYSAGGKILSGENGLFWDSANTRLRVGTVVSDINPGVSLTGRVHIDTNGNGNGIYIDDATGGRNGYINWAHGNNTSQDAIFGLETSSFVWKNNNSVTLLTVNSTGAITAPGPDLSSFTYGLAAGSMTVNDLSASQFVKTNASKKLISSSIGSGDLTWLTTSYIQLTETLQSGATFFTSSGTVNGQLRANGSVVSPIGTITTLNATTVNTSDLNVTRDITFVRTANQTNAVTMGYNGASQGGFESLQTADPFIAGSGATDFIVEGGGKVHIRPGYPTGSATATFDSGLVSLNQNTNITGGLNVSGQITAGSSATVKGAGGLGVTYGIVGGSVTASNLASGQCVQTGSGGILTVTGSACSSGSGGSSSLAVGTGTTSGYVGVPTSSPTAVLLFDQSKFNSALQGSATAFITIAYSTFSTSGAITLTSTHSVVGVDTSGGNVTITLPTAVGISGRIYTIKKLSSANTLTIATTSSQTIDDGTTATVTIQYTSLDLISNGSNWLIL